MSKKVFFLIILLLVQLGFFPHPVSAVTSCKDSRIDWTPRIFPEGETQYVINFIIQDTNTLETLKRGGPYVRLLADQGIFSWGGTYTNPPVKVESSKFSLVLTGNLATANIHKGILQYSPTETGTYSDFCSDIVYQVGTTGKCALATQSIPDKIPPNSSLTIKFIGRADTKYTLVRGDMVLLAGYNFSYLRPSVKTDNQGQGEFPSVIIQGNNGDSVRIGVNLESAGAGLDEKTACYKDTKIDVTAPPPALVPSGPVAPVPATAAVKQCPKEGETANLAIHLDPAQCTKGGGDPCNDKERGSAIKTAIGCIHTNPAEFIKDFLTFILGISGGLAFLLMLLGVFQMLTSAGNPETWSAGRDRLQSAIIGLLFIIFSVLLLRIIGVDILGLGKQFGL